MAESETSSAPEVFYCLSIASHDLILRMARTDEDFALVAEAVKAPIHDPNGPAPFANDWTSRAPQQRAEATVKLLRQHQLEIAPNNWNLELSVFQGDVVVGGVSLRAENYQVLKMAEIGLWVSFDKQGAGIGKDIVAAALSLAFDHFGILDVVYTAIEHNSRSLRVAERLGFEPNGYTYVDQNGERKRLLQNIMSLSRWSQLKQDQQFDLAAIAADLRVKGADECFAFMQTVVVA